MVQKCYKAISESPVPLFQNESKCEPFHMKMSSACSFILMQIALRLALKQRHKGTRKWPISMKSNTSFPGLSSYRLIWVVFFALLKSTADNDFYIG